jgi:hypothetical protein
MAYYFKMSCTCAGMVLKFVNLQRYQSSNKSLVYQGGLAKEDVELIVCHLLIEGYLKEDFHFTPYSTIRYGTGSGDGSGFGPALVKTLPVTIIFQR